MDKDPAWILNEPTWIRILCECCGNALAGGDALAGEGAGVLLEQRAVLEETARHYVRPRPAHAPAKPVILPSAAVLLVCHNIPLPQVPNLTSVVDPEWCGYLSGSNP
jgi:hypothetical protein